MTVIRNNSISGINSITAQSSALNFYDSTGNTLSIGADITGGVTVATGATISGSTNTIIASTNGSERVRIDSSGNFNLVNTAGVMTAFRYETPALINNHFKSNSTSAGAYVRMYASAGTGQWDIYNNGANLRFSDNASAGNIQMDRPLVMNSQNIVMSSGNGIDFSATADGSGTTTSELLDDYEEGTWTPDLRFNGSNTGITYSWRNGHYIRIGKQVTIRAAFGLSSKGTFTSTDAADIYGLPFNIQDYSGSGMFFYTFGGAYNGYGGLIMIEVQNTAAENNNVQLRKLSAFNTDSTVMQYQDVGGSQRVAFSLTYIAV